MFDHVCLTMYNICMMYEHAYDVRLCMMFQPVLVVVATHHSDIITDTENLRTKELLE